MVTTLRIGGTTGGSPTWAWPSRSSGNPWTAPRSYQQRELQDLGKRPAAGAQETRAYEAASKEAPFASCPRNSSKPLRRSCCSYDVDGEECFPETRSNAATKLAGDRPTPMGRGSSWRAKGKPSEVQTPSELLGSQAIEMLHVLRV